MISTPCRWQSVSAAVPGCFPRTVPEAVIASAVYEGKASGDVLEITGKLTVQVLTDDWVQLPLKFDHAALGAGGIGPEVRLGLAGRRHQANPKALGKVRFIGRCKRWA